MIFVYGGRNEKQLALNCGYFFNPATGQWKKVYTGQQISLVVSYVILICKQSSSDISERYSDMHSFK